MRSQKLFALNGQARGAARLVYEDIGGTLAVELAPRGAGEYEAWLASLAGPLLRAPLGPAMTALMPSTAKEAAGVFITGAGKIIASGSNGFSRTDMESAALRVQLALVQSAQAQKAPREEAPAPVEIRVEPPSESEPVCINAQQEIPKDAEPASAQKRGTIPASRVAESLFERMPVDTGPAIARDERAAQVLREASVIPEMKSKAAMSILTMANKLFYPTEADYAETSFLEKGAVVQKPIMPAAGQGMKRNMANAKKPMPPAQKNGVYPPNQRKSSNSPMRGNGAHPPMRGNGGNPSMQGNGANPSVQENGANPSVQGNGANPSEQKNGGNPPAQGASPPAQGASSSVNQPRTNGSQGRSGRPR